MTDYDNYDFWNPGEPDLYKDMEDDERIATAICHIAGMVICFVIMLGLCAMCSSCTTTQYIPVIEHHTDTLRQVTVRHDSVMVHDSIHVSEKGDTVRIERWHTQYRDREVHDTTYISKTDTVPAPYPVETIKEVEKPLSWWQKTLMWLGVAMIGIIAVWIWRTK